MTNKQADAPPELMRRIQAYVGRGSDLPGKTSRLAVNAGFIQQFTDIVGDRNPVYVDEAFAAKSIHGAIVAPPTALSMWRLRGLDPAPGSTWVENGVRHFRQDPNGVRVRGDDARTIRDEVNDVFLEFGYSSPVVTNETFEYHRYLRLGDHLTFASPLIKAIVGPKTTSLGEGFFVTLEQTVRDQDGGSVAVVEQRYLRFKPVAKQRRPRTPARPQEGREAVIPPDRSEATSPRETTLDFADAHVGDELPKLVIELTPTLIIGGAFATQDFQDVHHDRDIAIRRGHPDVFMNIVTSCGLVGRFVTDWAGPEALIRRLQIRLGRPNYPYDTLRLSGQVTTANASPTGGLVIVDVRGHNSLGEHVRCSLTLELPQEGGSR